MASSVADIAEMLSLYLERDKRWKVNSKLRAGMYGTPGKRFFDRAEPHILGLNDQLYTPEYMERELYFFDVAPGDLDKPLDICAMTTALDDENLINVVRVRAISPKDVRGKIYPPLPHPMEFSVVTLDRYFDGEITRFIVGSKGNFRWTVIGPRRDQWGTNHTDESISNVMQVLLGVEFTRRYEWTVHLRRSDGEPGILLPVDAIGAGEVFKLRDVPDGRSRRLALRRWIEEHWRQRRRDPQTEVKVREHLRGQSEFTWAGLVCTIAPARFDLERDETLRLEREQQRRNGTDRRLRVARSQEII